MKIIIQNEEDAENDDQIIEDQSSKNIVNSSSHHLSPNTIENKKSKGNFRGESFGNCENPRMQQENGDLEN